MKILLKTIGVFTCFLIVLMAIISVSSHARVYAVQHGAKQDINKMIMQHAEMKEKSPLMTPTPEKKP